MERMENLLRLTLAEGLGPATIFRLLRHFGDAQQVLSAGAARLRQVPRLSHAQIEAVLAAADFDPRPEMERAGRAGVRLVSYDDDEYPATLSELRDPPVLLYVRGTFAPPDAAGLAIVGTRSPTRYGARQARRFGSLAAHAGFTVVSGLARGVDTGAHQGALDAGGRTVAVLGSGLSCIYPEENRDLAAEIAGGGGVVVSEFRMDCEPTRDTFPRRNRLIAALGWGTLVVEAPVKSGALITARFAADLGREVFAIPGRVDEPGSAGCHKLLRDGAGLVAELDDLLIALPPELAARRNPQAEPRAAAAAAPESRRAKAESAPASLSGAREGGGRPPKTRPAQVPLRPRPPSIPPPDYGPAGAADSSEAGGADETGDCGAAPEPAAAWIPPRPAPAGADDQEIVYAALTGEPQPIDELAERISLPVERVSRALLLLELSRRAESFPGMLFARHG